jgi:hypothetical protein
MNNAKYIKMEAGVRYWEDALLNGRPDTHGNVPFRQGDLWCPLIDVDTGEVLGWSKGMHARIHYKVCDAGEYWLLDVNKQKIAKWNGYYVPDDVLCIGDQGYGDYIIFEINEDGYIKNWEKPYFDENKWNVLVES